MPKPKAHHLSFHFALVVIWQLIALITSTHAQAEIQSTLAAPSDACTRPPEFTGAPGAHFLCLSLEPSSTTAAEATSSLTFSSAPQETSSTVSSSFTVPQSFNSTSTHTISTSDSAVSTSTVYTTLRGNDPATSTSPPEQVQTMANATLSATVTSNTIRSQNSTTDSNTYIQIATLPHDSAGAKNATMFPVVLQTVTYTTTICPSSGWV